MWKKLQENYSLINKRGRSTFGPPTGISDRQIKLNFSDPIRPRVFLPTGGTKPPPTGSGKPDRFDRLPEKTGQIQNPNQKLMFNRFLSASQPVWPVIGRFEW